MPSAKELREIIQEKLDEAEAINTIAAEEDRDLTTEEQQQFDNLVAEVGEPVRDDQPATGLHAQLEKREKFERVRDEFAARRSDSTTDTTTTSDRIEPVSQFTHGSLKAYKDQKQAYNAGQFFAATLFNNAKADQYCREHGIYAAQAGNDNSLGGHLVPIETEAAIINLREERGVFRREAKIVPMASDTKIVPRRSSGLTAYFATDGGTLTDSEKKWDDVPLIAKKLYAMVYYSSELSEDSVVSIGDDLTAEIAYAFADKEDECGFNGDGTSTYGGIVGVLNAVAAGGTYTAASGNTAFATLDLADFEGIAGQLPQYAAMNAKWYISRVGYYQSMARLADAGGGNTTETLASGPGEKMFLGYPVVFTQVLNSTTTAQASTSILAFGDLAMAATLGNRRGISVMISEHARFTNDQLAIRGTQRFAINVHETAGAVQVMATPAS